MIWKRSSKTINIKDQNQKLKLPLFSMKITKSIKYPITAVLEYNMLTDDSSNNKPNKEEYNLIII